MYVDALKILAPSQRVPWFCFVAVETYPPHLMAVYDVRDDPGSQSYPFLQLGRAKYRTALQQYVWCMEHDEWPGYGDEHRDMLLPPWVKDAEDFGLA